MNRPVAVLAASVALLAGCSTSGTHAKSTPEASSTSVSPTSRPVPTSASPTATTPPVWSLAVARRNYLAYVKPGNDNLLTFNHLAATHSQNLSAYRSACRQIARDDDTLARQMVAGSWPTVAKSAATDFGTALARERVAYQSCASADTFAALNVAIAQRIDASGAAESVRVALGLPGTA